MRVVTGFVASAALILGLAGTASAAEQGWRQVAFNCESGQVLNVAIKETGKAARVTVGENSPLRLVARPSKEGDRFADSRHELRVTGDAATWQIGNRTPVQCSAAEGATLAAE